MTVVTQNKIDILVGMIAPFGMSSVPTGWLACDGSTVSRTYYADLFTAIGTTWGAGDGSSTFALPDLEGAFLRGTGANATHATAQGESYKFTGPNVGSFEDDKLQNHEHDIHSFSDADTSKPVSNNGSGNATVDKISIDGSATGSGLYWYGTKNMWGSSASNSGHTPPGGTPRTGYETQPFNAGVKYCIKF